MKILHWDEMFHPAFGYQINVLTKFQAKQGHEIVIITSDHINKHPTFSSFSNNANIEMEDKLFSQKYGIKIVRLPIYRVVSGRVIYKGGYLNRIIDEKPDIIMCHTNDTLSSIRIAQNYKKINIPIVFDNHMLEMASKNPFSKLFRLYFKMFVTPIIIKNKWIVVRTQNDDYVNKHLGIPKSLTPFLSFGSDTTIFNQDKEKKVKFRRENGINDDDFVVIYAGKLTEDKGGMILAKAIEKKFNLHKNIVLIIVGNINKNSEYEMDVERVFQSSENRILRFPTQNYVNLPEFYQASDLCLFPKQCSLSFFDAQACGLPVIAEDNNINIDRISHNNGLLYRENDIDDLRDKIIQVAEFSDEIYEEYSNNAQSYVKENYDYKDIAEEYTKILIEEYERFHNRKVKR